MMILRYKISVTILLRFFSCSTHVVDSTFLSLYHRTENPVFYQLKRCSDLKELRLYHASMIKHNIDQVHFYVNQFLCACSSLHQMDYAIRVFTYMKNPNVYVYNALIKGLTYCSLPIQALQFYQQMLHANVSPSSFTFSALILCCTQFPIVECGETIHGQIWKSGFYSNIFVQTGLISFYSNFEMIADARKVFDKMLERDVVSWTAMISAYTRQNDLVEAHKLFDDMKVKGTVTWNTMIISYARAGDVENATKMFKLMPVKDIVSWTTMISCYSQNKLFKDALNIFEEMKSLGISADEITMSTVISACAHLGALDFAKDVHLYVMQNDFNLDVYIGSALIDMYAKCGSIERALVVFFKLEKKNLFCWNSLIEGLAIHGKAVESLAIFRKMEKENIKPNGVTFVSVLSACTHAGLVEVGRRIFERMPIDYSISPEIVHYGCMVDLLGRAGLIEDALALIKTMSIEPNAAIWGALLAGCKIHGNLEIGESAVKNLMMLEPNNSGYYTLLINMYAELNRWSEIERLRSEMKGRGIEKKSPGRSWIDLGNEVFEFVASDKSHPFCEEISMILIELDGLMKLSGFVPEMNLID